MNLGYVLNTIFTHFVFSNPLFNWRKTFAKKTPRMLFSSKYLAFYVFFYFTPELEKNCHIFWFISLYIPNFGTTWCMYIWTKVIFIICICSNANSTPSLAFFLKSQYVHSLQKRIDSGSTLNHSLQNFCFPGAFFQGSILWISFGLNLREKLNKGSDINSLIWGSIAFSALQSNLSAQC
jgi:hypothetical protein